jgi:molybdopterin synthase sulfur carrier subunit
LKVLIKFLGPISRDDLEVDVENIDELKKIIKENVSSEWIESLAVAVNDNIVNDLNEIKDGDVISLLPPVCGG